MCYVHMVKIFSWKYERVYKKKCSSPLPPSYLVPLFIAKLVELLCMYKKIQIYVSKNLFYTNGGMFYKLFCTCFSHFIMYLRNITITINKGVFVLFLGLCWISLWRCTKIYLIHRTLMDIKLFKYLAIVSNTVMNNEYE